MKLYTKNQMEQMFIAGGKMAWNIEAPDFYEVLETMDATGIPEYIIDGQVFIDYMDAMFYCDKNNLGYEEIQKQY